MRQEAIPAAVCMSLSCRKRVQISEQYSEESGTSATRFRKRIATHYKPGRRPECLCGRHAGPTFRVSWIGSSFRRMGSIPLVFTPRRQFHKESGLPSRKKPLVGPRPTLAAQTTPRPTLVSKGTPTPHGRKENRYHLHLGATAATRRGDAMLPRRSPSD